MFIIRCPWCGDRSLIEFASGGEAHIERPADPDAVDNRAWADYLFFRRNTRGAHRERWFHAFGCRRWFNALRDTSEDRILVTYAPGERPDAPGERRP